MMFRPRWVVVMVVPDSHVDNLITQDIDGPFRFKWFAEATANMHRAHEAQRARYEHDAMRRIEVWEDPE